MDFVRAYPLLIPFITILLAEITKAFIDLFRKRKKVRFLNPGGTVSGHSAFVTSLVVVVAYREGIQSTAFLIAAAIALVVMYDAIYLRNEAGLHARALNKIDKNLKLEESLGHTHGEVIAGALFGSVVAYLFLVI